MRPPNGFAALVNREDRQIGGFCSDYSLPTAVLFLTSVEQLFEIQVKLCQSFNGKFRVKKKRLAD